jgi:hypothetical protein
MAYYDTINQEAQNKRARAKYVDEWPCPAGEEMARYRLKEVSNAI